MVLREKASGKYFGDKKVRQSFKTSCDENLAQRLWDASKELTHIQSR